MLGRVPIVIDRSSEEQHRVLQFKKKVVCVCVRVSSDLITDVYYKDIGKVEEWFRLGVGNLS